MPLPNNRSSLVWVERPQTAREIVEAAPHIAQARLEEHLTGLLGPLSHLTPCQSFPLIGMQAQRFAGDRLVLVGESGHAIPPIGAQGLNLGIRDLAMLYDCLKPSRARRDPGATAVTEAYDEARRFDVASRTAMVDLLNRSLISDSPVASAARSLGMHAMAGIGALRRRMMREAMAPLARVPSLMRVP